MGGKNSQLKVVGQSDWGIVVTGFLMNRGKIGRKVEREGGSTLNPYRS